MMCGMDGEVYVYHYFFFYTTFYSSVTDRLYKISFERTEGAEVGWDQWDVAWDNTSPFRSYPCHYPLFGFDGI